MPDFQIRIDTQANLEGAKKTADELSNVGRSAEQAAQRLRILANIEASRRGRESSGFDDRSGAAEARIQRRLAAQREEMGLTQQSIPITEQATRATDKFGLSNAQAAVALKQLAREIPGVNIAAMALRNPYLAVAAAAAAMVLASRKAKDEALAIAAEQEQRLSNSVNVQIEQLTALKTAHEQAASAARKHKDALAELERQASGIDARLAEMDEDAQRRLREDNARAAAAKSKELLGIAGLPEAEREQKTREINLRFEAEQRAREQQALSGQAARLAEADRQARQAAVEARRAIPGAEAGLEAATEQAATNAARRKKVEEARENLRAELRQEQARPEYSYWKRALFNATFGMFGQAPQPGRGTRAVEADIARFTEVMTGFGAGAEQDQDQVQAWENYLRRLRGIEAGGDRFRPRLRSALGAAATARIVGGFEDEAAAVNEQIAKIHSEKVAMDQARQEALRAISESRREIADMWREIGKLHQRQETNAGRY